MFDGKLGEASKQAEQCAHPQGEFKVLFRVSKPLVHPAQLAAHEVFQALDQ